MKSNRQKSKVFRCALAILLIVFSMRLISSPLTYTNTNQVSSSKNPAHKAEFQMLLTDFSEAETFTSIEFNQIINRGLQDIHRYLNRNLNIIIIPIIGSQLFIIVNQFWIIYFTKPRSILAFNIGGHAPPEGQAI